jgi:hypothetical protein
VNSDRYEIAVRVRGLLGGQDSGDLAATARRLDIEELALRMTIDEDSPHPVIDVLVAVIATYGVDPTWLLTGEYDAQTHRRALDGDRQAVAESLMRLSNRPTPSWPLALVRDDEPGPSADRSADQA